jgi:hypothetical protein
VWQKLYFFLSHLFIWGTLLQYWAGVCASLLEGLVSLYLNLGWNKDRTMSFWPQIKVLHRSLLHVEETSCKWGRQGDLTMNAQALGMEGRMRPAWPVLGGYAQRTLGIFGQRGESYPQSPSVSKAEWICSHLKLFVLREKWDKVPSLHHQMSHFVLTVPLKAQLDSLSVSLPKWVYFFWVQSPSCFFTPLTSVLLTVSRTGPGDYSCNLGYLEDRNRRIRVQGQSREKAQVIWN